MSLRLRPHARRTCVFVRCALVLMPPHATAPPHTRHPHTSERARGPRGRTNLHHHHALPRSIYRCYYLCPPRRLAPDAGRRAAGGGCGWPSSLPRCAPRFTLSVARAAYRAPSRPFSLLLPFPFCPSLTCSHCLSAPAQRAPRFCRCVSRLQAPGEPLSLSHSAHAHTSQSRIISSKSPQSPPPPPPILIPLGQSNLMSHVYARWPVDQWWMVDWWTCGAGGYRRDAYYGALSMRYAL